MRLSGSVGDSQSLFETRFFRLRSNRRSVFVARILDPRLLREPLDVFLPVLPAVAAHDRLHRRVGFQHRRVHGERLALVEPALDQDAQHEGEHLLVNLQRQPLADHGERRMVGCSLRYRQAEELSKRQAVATAPGDPALRVDSLEVAHQQHPEIHARRNRRPTLNRRVVRAAELFHEPIEPRLVQHLIHPLVERVPGRPGQLRGRHPQPFLHSTSTTQRHPHPPLAARLTIHGYRPQLRDANFSTGCY